MIRSNKTGNTRWRGQLIGITVGILAAVMIAPATDWLMRLELYNFMHNRSSYIVGYHRIPASVQRDFDVQLAEAVRDGMRVYPMSEDDIKRGALDGRVQAMHRLAEKYPDAPAVYGTAVLYAMAGSVYCNRDADEKVLEYAPINDGSYVNRPNDAPKSSLTAYIADCASGERTDPNNAYFPAFHAYGLFAEHRDNEAVSELIAASNKPYYKEYYENELDGNLKIDEARQGGKEGMTRISVGAAVLFPHLSRIRDLSRLSTAIALGDEMRGDKEGGFEIRRANRRLGGLMRHDGGTIITSLVGIAMTHIAADKPDGIVPKGYAGLNSDGKDQAKDDTYVAYLRRIGHPEEAVAFQAEREADRQIRAITKAGVNDNDWDNMLLHAAMLWSLAYLFLWNVCSIAIFGLLALMLSRVPTIRSGAGISSAPVRAGIGFGASLCLIALSWWITGQSSVEVSVSDLRLSDFALAVVTITLATAVVLAVYFVTRWLARTSQNRNGSPASAEPRYTLNTLLSANRRAFVWASAGTIVALAAMWQVVAWAAENLSSNPYRLWMSLQSDYSSGPSTKPSGPDPLSLIAIVALPVLIMLIAALFLRRRRPASVAVVQALRASATPIVCVLLIACAGLVCYTARVEAASVQKVDLMWNGVGEGQYYAALEHRPWPGLVR